MSLKMHGFCHEITKEAVVYSLTKAVNPAWQAAKPHLKTGIGWGAGLTALDQAMKPPHVSLETPERRTKRLAKDVATMGTDVAVFSGLESYLRKRKPLPGAYKTLKSGQKMKALGIFGRKAGRFGAALAGGSLASYLLGKVVGRDKPLEVPINLQR